MRPFRVLFLLLLLAWPLPARTATTAETLLRDMSPEEKIGQLFCVYFKGPKLTKATARMLDDLRPGGVILYASAKNIKNNRQVAALTRALQRRAAQGRSRIGLFIAVDQEGGPVARFRRHFTLFPSNMAAAATGNPENAALAAGVTAKELGVLGVNVNFAPVADVNSNPKNPIIGVRSFGDDPTRVAAFTAAAVRACKRENILCTPKHFPGHGDTSTDSHVGLPVVEHDARTLNAVDIPPFAAAIRAGADAIMTAHVHLPAVDPTPGLPATLSSRILTGLLRRDLGFDGLIFTDSMTMGALARRFGLGEAAVRAVLAGADILLYGADKNASPSMQRRAFAAVRRAVRSGRIPMARLDDSVRRILRVKARYGLLDARAVPSPPKNPDALVGTPAQGAAAEAVARQSITLVRDNNGVLPLSPRTPTLVVRPRRGVGRIDAAAEAALAGWPNIQLVAVGANPTKSEIRSVCRRAKRAKAVVAFSNDALRRPGQAELILALYKARPDHFTAVASGAPYDLLRYPGVPTCVCAYGEVPASMRALGRALFGFAPMPGALPVNLPGAGRPVANPSSKNLHPLDFPYTLP